MNRRDFLIGLAAAAGAGCRSAGRRRSAHLRVVTYNTHHGEGVDGRLDLERVAGVIREANPDLVALQEVDRRARRTGGIDQAIVYAKLTGLHGWYGAAMPFQGGEYGQMLLARWPLRDPQVVRLPGTPGREPRIAVTAQIEAPGFGRIQWGGVHLDATRTDEDRWEQVGALLGRFGRDGVPTLLAGDFNDTPESRVMRRMLDPSAGWYDTAGAAGEPTVPAEVPRSRIDYILAWPGDGWRVLDSEVLSEAVASDHRPVLAILARAD